MKREREKERKRRFGVNANAPELHASSDVREPIFHMHNMGRRSISIYYIHGAVTMGFLVTLASTLSQVASWAEGSLLRPDLISACSVLPTISFPVRLYSDYCIGKDC